jgi:AraC-like DNA-binding protein
MSSDLFSSPTRGLSAAESECCRAHFLRIFRAAAGQCLANTLNQRLTRFDRGADSRSLIDTAVAYAIAGHYHLRKSSRHRFSVTPNQYYRNT